MALKYDERCKTCQVIQAESPNDRTKSKLYKLIEQAQVGKMPLTDVARAYPNLRYLRIHNHSRKHQATTERRIAQAQVQQDEKRIMAKSRSEVVHHTERRSTALEVLQNMMDQGQLKGATFSAMAALLKQETDIEEKQKDRVHEMQKLFASYIANPLPYDPSGKEWLDQREPRRDIQEGEVVESDSPPSTL
jgi:hypothetical protein